MTMHMALHQEITSAEYMYQEKMEEEDRLALRIA